MTEDKSQKILEKAKIKYKEAIKSREDFIKSLF